MSLFDVQTPLKSPDIHKFVEPLVDLMRKFFRSRSLWRELKKIQLDMQHRRGESSDDGADAIYDGDDGLSYGRDSKPLVTKVLRLLTPVLTRWKCMYYLTKRALALKDP